MADSDSEGDEDPFAAADDIAATADEARYELEDAAVRPLQALVRRKLAIKYAREYGRQVFIKEWDEDKKRCNAQR